MPFVFLPFDGWSPGLSHFGEGWRTATNLFPFRGTWRPWRKFTGSANTVAFGPITGAFVHLWTAGGGTASYEPDAATLFCGSKTRLFAVDPAAGTFADVSRAANYGAAGEPAGWRFASVGNDIWATNWFDVPQRRTNNAGVFADGITSTFVPQPRHLATIREHLVGANLSNAARFQDEVVWSDADNAVNFDPPTGTSTSLAGSKRLASIPGQITGLLGGQYGLAFKRKGIYYLEYTGTTQVLRPDVLSSNVGTAYPSSIINSRYGVFFLGSDGFYKMVGLSEPVKISPLGVEEDFWGVFSTGPSSPLPASSEDRQIVGFDFPNLPLVGWAFRTDWTETVNDKAVVYNPVADRWGRVTLSPGLATMIVRPEARGQLFSQLAGFPWDGANSKFFSLSETPTGGNIIGPLLATRFRPMNFETADTEFRQTLLSGILPVISKDGAFTSPALTPSVTVETALDPFQIGVATESRPSTERNTTSGVYPLRAAGRLARITITCAAEDYASFEGVYVDQRLLT